MAKQKRTFTKSDVLRSLGVLLALFGTSLLLSPLTRLRYLAYPLHFLFGDIGLWVFSLLAIEGGLHLIFHKIWKAYPRRVVLGIFLFLLGGWVLLSAIYGLPLGETALTDFVSGLNAAYETGGPALYFSPLLAPGFLGTSSLLALSSPGAWLAYLVSSAAMALGLILLFWPLLVMAFRAIRLRGALKKARKLQAEEEVEATIGDDYIPPEFASDAPVLTFAPERKSESEPIPLMPERKPSEPTESIRFAPAGGSTLPPRSVLRSAKGPTPTPVEGNPVTPMPPTAPIEIDTPVFASPAQAPRPAGLREARFVPAQPVSESAGAPATPVAPPPSQPAPHVSVFDPAALVPNVPAAPEPKPAEEPKPVSEPVVPVPARPVTGTIAMPVIPAPETQEFTFEEEESDEDLAPVVPINDPIVLTPNPSVIITPEVPEPEPEIPPVEEEEEEEVDDDLEGPLPPYTFPGVDLLSEGTSSQDLAAMEEQCRAKAESIDRIFADFGVGAHVSEFLIGPSITRYSIAADAGVSVSAIARVIPDLEVRLGGVPVRFVERVYGLACSALEVANETRRTVSFKEVFQALPARTETADLHIPFGVDIAGKLREADLAKFPHMLVGGTSGSGKSIFAHGILMSLVMRNRPEDLKLILIDPKRGVEMAPYKDLPHLLCPIIKEAKPARNALKKLCDLMDKRYLAFEEVGVRDIKSYNADYALPEGKKRMPYVVVLVDEFSDLVGECKEISDYVLRIAQKARACGIHLIVATQRPDVKVITGTIKSNLLCRVALTVASYNDSATILGQSGAEDLYGMGDMLIDCQELSKRDFVRAQGCFCTGREMKAVCDFIRAQLPPKYDPDFLNLEGDEDESSGPEIRDGTYMPEAPTISNQELKKMADEDKYQYVKSVIMTREYCSISMIQREFEVGFPRAGKILARLQAEGIVASPGDTPNNSKGCRVLVHADPSSES